MARNVFLSLVVVAAIALLPGCQSQQTEEKPAAGALSVEAPAVPGATRDHAGKTIVYYGDSTVVGAQLEQALAKRFERDTGIQVEIIPHPTSAGETYSVYQRLFQAKSGDIDVLMVDVIWPGALAPHLADLGPQLGREASRHFSSIVANNTVSGRLVAMPWFTDVGLLYYRKDLLDKYGYSAPPRTWSELEAMAERIQTAERKANPKFTGFVWQGNTYEGLTCNALEWQAGHGGGRIVNPTTGQVEIDTPRARVAFSRAANWVGRISPKGVTSYTEEEARNVFQSGNALFMRNWPYAYPAGSAEGSSIKGKFEVAPLPHEGEPAATLGGWHLAVSAYSKKSEAAIDFVRYMASREVQTWRAIHGSYLPTIPSVYQDPEVLEAQPVTKVMASVLKHAVPRPSTPTGEYYNEVSTLYFQGVADILQGGDAATVLAETQQDIERLLR